MPVGRCSEVELARNPRDVACSAGSKISDSRSKSVQSTPGFQLGYTRSWMHRFVRDRAFALFGAIVLAATVLDLLMIHRADPPPIEAEVSQRAPTPVVVPAPARPLPAEPPPAPRRVVIIATSVVPKHATTVKVSMVA